MKRQCLVLLAFVTILMVSSCGDDSTGTRGPNMPPDTQIVSGPDSGSTASYRAEIHWTGSDEDGRVDAYEFAWLIGSVAYDSLGPDPDIDWQYTTKTESTFAARADSSIGGGIYSRQNTFFVRAIDNDGARDPEPARLTYTATTVAPRAHIIYPDLSGQTSTNQPRCVTIRWEGLDEDGEAVAYRSAVVPFLSAPPPQWDKTRWTPWSGSTEAILALTEDETIFTWTFYVQALDNAGATETSFQPGRNQLVINIDPAKESKPWVEICAFRGMSSQAGSKIACRSTSNPSQMSVPVHVAIGDTICFIASFLPGTYATYVGGITFRVNDSGRPYYFEDAVRPTNSYYPGVDEPAFEVRPGIYSIYVWVQDDYCEYGSTNYAYIEVIGD